MAFSVMTPASSASTGALARLPSSNWKVCCRMPWIRFNCSVLMITQPRSSGTAPPVSPVPAPRGMALSPIRPMAASSGATCSAVSGMATATGRARRQSVASVAWARFRRRRRPGALATSARKPASSSRQAARTRNTSGSPPACASTIASSLQVFSKKRSRRPAEASSSWNR